MTLPLGGIGWLLVPSTVTVYPWLGVGPLVVVVTVRSPVGGGGGGAALRASTLASHVAGTKPKFHVHRGSTVPASPCTAKSASYSASVCMNRSDIVVRLVKPSGLAAKLTTSFDIVTA